MTLYAFFFLHYKVRCSYLFRSCSFSFLTGLSLPSVFRFLCAADCECRLSTEHSLFVRRRSLSSPNINYNNQTQYTKYHRCEIGQNRMQCEYWEQTRYSKKPTTSKIRLRTELIILTILKPPIIYSWDILD